VPDADDDLAAFGQLPKVGDVFLGFELIGELGRGGFGRVFLAKQKELADRPVALKVTVGPDAESQNLARLQHTNIMPIHSVHKARRMVAVCMPFYGRTTLADLCSSLDTLHTPPASGGHVVGTLAARRDSTQAGYSSRYDTRPDESTVRSPSTPRPPVEPVLPNLSVLRTMSYVDAVLWIGQRIATGLAHAHDRGIIHRDLKPANILLADDGQPMILDFNLSADIGDQGRRGGTVPYMAPEQLRMMAGEDALIDPRSDVYSLGLLLAQMLTGRYPFVRRKGGATDLLRQMIADRATPPRLRSNTNRAISPAVEAIVHKCLANDPAERYQSAHDLIEDLERHQTDRPTKYAPNPSVRERATKWARRNPRLTSPLMVAAAVAAVLFSAAAGVGWALVSAERASLARNADRGRELVAEFDTLHGTAEQYLTSHNGNPELITRGRENGFRALDTLTDRLGDRWADRPEFRHLPDADKQRLAGRASELVFLLGQLGGRAGQDDFWGRLADAAPHSGRSVVLRAAELHADGKFRESVPDLQRYTRTHPDDAGGWFLLGRASAETGNNDDAYLAYSAGIALRPRYAAGYYFRAVLADRLRKADPVSGQPQAILDADRAVELDPDFVEGRLLRAQLRVQLKRHAEAEKDLDAILDGAAPPTRAWLLRAVAREHLGDKTGAAADRAEGLKREPTTAADFIARGVARRKASPTAALADFKSAEELDPLNTAALENQAYVQAELLHRPDQAVDTLSRLLYRTPHSPLAFISRAVYLARSGKTAEAVADAEKATELSTAPGIEYRVGCVYALAAKADPKYAAPALKHLSAALKAGFGYEHLPTDSDLHPLRGRAEFDRLTELTKLLNTLGGAK
jgi:serine/threonine protein kinase/predicted Zn-dependent protease